MEPAQHPIPTQPPAPAAPAPAGLGTLNDKPCFTLTAASKVSQGRLKLIIQDKPRKWLWGSAQLNPTEFAAWGFMMSSSPFLPSHGKVRSSPILNIKQEFNDVFKRGVSRAARGKVPSQLCAHPRAQPDRRDNQGHILTAQPSEEEHQPLAQPPGGPRGPKPISEAEVTFPAVSGSIKSKTHPRPKHPSLGVKTYFSSDWKWHIFLCRPNSWQAFKSPS